MSPRTFPITSTPLAITEKFIIYFDSDSESSSACSTPYSEATETSILEVSDPIQRANSVPTPPPRPLQPLIEDWLEARKCQLGEACISSREAAIHNHLYSSPVTPADVRLLIPQCNRKPYTIINKMCTNIGLFRSRGQISDVELEDIYIHLFTAADPQLVVYGKAHSNVARFQQRAEGSKRKAEEERVAEQQRKMEQEARRSNAGGKKLRRAKKGAAQAELVWRPQKISSAKAALAAKLQKLEVEKSFTQTGTEFNLEDEEDLSGLLNGFDRSCIFNRKGEAIHVRLPAIAPSCSGEETSTIGKGDVETVEAEFRRVERAHPWAKSGSIPIFLFHKKKGKRPTIHLPEPAPGAVAKH
ncbi:hypothetical protein K491DRAFT_681089 [Lophiostoma macrostomum CBS 122681]|uniref:Uncharacterized protein n=1 Tax=Lophiostoma macrostomum CBS 122681 TaxID=1314788 RepID=A0A6A6SYZ0_9PLEO|nr:hypothetical protein K491DRAFT_681089 [Lophiostoma macrostomum CBS 122681]